MNMIDDKAPVEAVVIDMDYNLSRLKIVRAEIYLKNPKCLFLVGITDMTFPLQSRGISIIGRCQYTLNSIYTIYKL